MNKQLKFLEDRKRAGYDAKAALILLSQRATTISREDVKKRGQSLFTRISYLELDDALDATLVAAPIPELRELVEGYKVALKEQEARTRCESASDPNC